MGKKCIFENCTTYSTYGLLKNKPLHCKKHKLENENDVLNKMCEKCEIKQATYGVEKTKALWCKMCKLDEAFDVKHKMCEYEKCNTRPNFGSTKALRCSSHKIKDDKAFGYKKCETKNCKLVPSFSDNIENVALRCSKHKLDNWVDVSHKSALCKFKNCNLQSTFGLLNGKAEYCSIHKLKDMIDIKHKKCEFKECNMQASFGELNGKRIFCTEHKDKNHISLKNMIHGELYTALYNNLCSSKSKDKKLNREFDLTLDFLFELYDKQNKKCYYCKNILNVKNCNKKNLDQVSVDRVDSNHGHIKENCVLACLFCNLSKTDSHIDEYNLFLKFIKNPKEKNIFEMEDNSLDWITSIMNRITQKNKQTNITKQWLQQIFEKQNGLCFYSNIKMIITKKKRYLFKPSIERIDCSKKYTKENCVLVLFGVNLGKNDFDVLDYTTYINKLRIN